MGKKQFFEKNENGRSFFFAPIYEIFVIYSSKIFTSETPYQKKITFLMIRGGFFDEKRHPTKIFGKILVIKIPNFGKIPSPWDENPESK